MENSNNPTYAQLISYVLPFFLSRGGDDFASTERILFYLNCSIQDIFNTDSPTFMYKTEILREPVVDGSNHKFVTTYPILKMQECYGSDWWEEKFTDKMEPELMLIRCKHKYRFQGKQILVDQWYTAIEVAYIRDYEWVTDLNRLDEEIPLPKRYIPALVKLIYDWAAPINLTQSEASTVDFYSHAANRIDKLAIQDSLTDVYWITK